MTKEQLEAQLLKWGQGCNEAIEFFNHRLRVVDMRTHLVVYETIGRKNYEIGQYQKDDKLWRYKALLTIFKGSTDEHERQVMGQIVALRLIGSI